MHASKSDPRKQAGNSSLEFAATLPLLVILLLVSVDCAFFVYANDLCDRVCRQCAKAAGKMATPDDAVNAMNAVAAAPRIDGMVIRQIYPELLAYRDQNTSTALPTPAYGTTSSYAGRNGPNNIKPETNVPQRDKLSCPGPYLVVRTTAVMRLPFGFGPFPSRAFNSTSNKQDLDEFKIQSTCSYPITNTFSP